jgi:hypothetical protein
MASLAPGFLPSLTAWLATESAVEAAVLYGSKARANDDLAPADAWSDFDLHVITTSVARLERTNWRHALPGQEYCLHVERLATGGVRKLTVVFVSGEIELVLVPALRLKLARLVVGLGLHRKLASVRAGLNEIGTSMRPGYRFLKGETQWAKFYARVVAEMPGVRVGDEEARRLADAFLADLLCGMQRLERGELAAAQHLLHRFLAETNFRLLRELRLRRGQPLPSFGLGRRVEALIPANELAWVNVDARLTREELRAAAWRAFEGMQALMRELVPAWSVPAAMGRLLAPYRGSGR